MMFGDLVRLGLRQLFGGARRGQPVLSGLGMALTLIGWARRRSGRRKELIYSQTLRQGENVEFRLVGDRVVVTEDTTAAANDLPVGRERGGRRRKQQRA